MFKMFSKDKCVDILAPIEGEVHPLSTMEDEAFSSGALGKGVCILPFHGQVFSPVSGKVTLLFPTLHAIGIQSNDGVEVLIHIGMDTVNLNGKHFSAYVKQGDKVKVGQKLIEFDYQALKDLNINLQTPVVITNTDQFKEVNVVDIKQVQVGETVINIKK